MKKLKSGVLGFDSIINGGINHKSITLIVGAPGVGKTTFALRFIKRGIDEGDDALFVSLDENKEQIIAEAEEMGWNNIRNVVEESRLVFIDAGGKKFSEFVRSELPLFVEEWKGANTRIAIDPLTPIIWAVENKYEQRELLMLMFKEFKKIGTVVCTLEEHGIRGDLSGPETIIPMYLADTVVHLKYVDDEGVRKRQLHILKCRNSRHSHRYHHYVITRELGFIVKPRPATGTDAADTQKRISEEIDAEINALPAKHAERLKKIAPYLMVEDFNETDIKNLIEDFKDSV